MYPHRINLRGPWDAQPLRCTRLRRDGSRETVDGAVPPPLKMLMPTRWTAAGLPGFQGEVRFRRGFSWPKPLANHERMWLLIQGADAFASVRLNEVSLGSYVGPFLPFEMEITPLLRERNELLIDVDCPKADPLAAADWLWRGALPAGGGLWGTVALEVRREAFLRLSELHTAWNSGEGTVHLAGAVIGGGATGPLDLSVRLGERELYHGPLVEQDFALNLPTGAVAPWLPLEIGQPVLHELEVQLCEPASLIDRQVYAVGFCTIQEEAERWLYCGKEGPSPEVHPWLEPAAEMAAVASADQEGKPIVLELPVRPGGTSSAARRSAAEEVVRQLTAAARAHPAVVGLR